MEKEQTRKKQEPLGFKKTIWEAKSGKLLRRTPQSWAKILIFYACFLSGVWTYFWILWKVFDTTLTDGVPKRQAGDSVLGTVPGMAYRPSYIDYSPGKADALISELDAFLEPYYRAGRIPEHPCTRENKYNYMEGSPCVFLKLNRVYGWRPGDYQEGDSPGVTADNDTVTVTCTRRGPGRPLKFSYHPPGFPKSDFPFENQEGYLSPLVAVVPNQPEKGSHVRIECRAWAPNIRHEPENSKGSVRFEVYVGSN